MDSIESSHGKTPGTGRVFGVKAIGVGVAAAAILGAAAQFGVLTEVFAPQGSGTVANPGHIAFLADPAAPGHASLVSPAHIATGSGPVTPAHICC